MTLQARQLCKEYRSAAEHVTALYPLDLDISAGEVLAVTGPSGCGKTTLLHLLGLLLTPTQGSLKVDGVESSSANDRMRRDLRKRAVGFVFQDALLVSHLTVLENVHLWRDTVSEATAKDALASLGIEDLAGRKPAALSGGQQQRAAVARALAASPLVLLADEPTANLDDDNASAVATELQAHAHRGGAVIIASHDARVLASATRRLELDRGRVVGDA